MNQGWVFEQNEAVADGVWERFTVRDANGNEQFLDVKVRPRYRGEMERLTKKHQREEIRQGMRIRDIPGGKKAIEFAKDVADYLIADWGGEGKHDDDGNPVPYGPPGRFSKDGGRIMNIRDAALCGIPNEPDTSVPSEVRVWPCERNFKYLLLRIAPDLDTDITEFAGRIASAVEGTEEQEQEAVANLGPSPSSEGAPSSSATAER